MPYRLIAFEIVLRSLANLLKMLVNGLQFTTFQRVSKINNYNTSIIVILDCIAF